MKHFVISSAALRRIWPRAEQVRIATDTTHATGDFVLHAAIGTHSILRFSVSMDAGPGSVMVPMIVISTDFRVFPGICEIVTDSRMHPLSLIE